MYRIGIDLGGTNIVSGVVDKDNKIIGKGKLKTNMPRPAEQIVDDMAKTVFMAIEDAGITLDEVEALGVGAPGAIDPESGAVVYSNNLDFYNLPMVDMLRERIGKDFFIDNDANAAAYGEYIAGAGKGTKNFVAITLGTGVGGGIILDGKIYSGFNYAGAELGHMVITMNGEKCTCGRYGCWEAYASATALINQTVQAMRRYPDCLMWKLCDGDTNKVTGITAFEAMRKNDPVARMVVDRYCEYIAVGISNIINIFQPNIVCIGGGISHEGDTLLNPIRGFVAGENFARDVKNKAEIKAATLGNDAGIIGAANLCDLYGG